MPSTLVAPPAVEPVTLAETKAHLRVAHADEDALIGSLIASARRQIEARTGLALIEQGWIQFHDDWPGDGVVALAPAPISPIDELAVYGDDDVKAVIDPAHYYLDAASHPPRLMLRGSRLWARPGRIGNGIAIALSAGFGLAGSAVPEPLRQAILQLVAHWYEHRGNADAPPPPLTIETLIGPYREFRL
jgi:uncharacterized phiE125 gp8 family phage protein